MSDIIGQEFESDTAVQTGIDGFVDHTHTAAAEFFEDAIVRKNLSDQRLLGRHLSDILGVRIEVSQ